MVWQICKQKVVENSTFKEDFLGKFCNKYRYMIFTSILFFRNFLF